MLPSVQVFSNSVSLQIVLLVVYLAWSIRFAFQRAAEVNPKATRFSLVMVVFSTAFFAFLGGSVFQILIDVSADFSMKALDQSLQNSGRLFYGALLGGAFGFWLAIQNVDQSIRFEYWNGVAAVAAMGYGILRLGCFANGCCWGSLSEHFWAVSYTHPESLMPYHGVPVHPVQLYDSALGFFLYFVLGQLRQKNLNQAAGFLLIYPVGRFVTEMFRGDAERGLNVLGSLSLGQVHSLGLLALVTLFYLFKLSFSRTIKDRNWQSSPG